MPTPETSSVPPPRLNAERVAYWYFRLNGFLQIENFVVHPRSRGGQRTDADLLAVRFPYRAERLIDNPDDIMADDERGLALSSDLIDVAIVEVKTNDPCTLNGPWTAPERQNVNRVVAAIGCVPRGLIDVVATAIYQHGVFEQGALRIRLIAVGRVGSPDLAERFPQVVQVTWRHVFDFMWERFHKYRRQKTQVQQWDAQGQLLKRLADANREKETFITTAISRMSN